MSEQKDSASKGVSEAAPELKPCPLAHESLGTVRIVTTTVSVGDVSSYTAEIQCCGGCGLTLKSSALTMDVAVQRVTETWNARVHQLPDSARAEAIRAVVEIFRAALRQIPAMTAPRDFDSPEMKLLTEILEQSNDTFQAEASGLVDYIFSVVQLPELNLEDKNSGEMQTKASSHSSVVIPESVPLDAARHAFDPIGNGVDECECGLTLSAPIHLSDDVVDDRFVPFVRPSSSGVLRNPDRGTSVRNEPESSSDISLTLAEIKERRAKIERYGHIGSSKGLNRARRVIGTNRVGHELYEEIPSDIVTDVDALLSIIDTLQSENENLRKNYARVADLYVKAADRPITQAGASVSALSQNVPTLFRCGECGISYLTITEALDCHSPSESKSTAARRAAEKIERNHPQKCACAICRKFINKAAEIIATELSVHQPSPVQVDEVSNTKGSK